MGVDQTFDQKSKKGRRGGGGRPSFALRSTSFRLFSSLCCNCSETRLFFPYRLTQVPSTNMPQSKYRKFIDKVQEQQGQKFSSTFQRQEFSLVPKHQIKQLFSHSGFVRLLSPSVARYQIIIFRFNSINFACRSCQERDKRNAENCCVKNKDIRHTQAAARAAAGSMRQCCIQICLPALVLNY